MKVMVQSMNSEEITTITIPYDDYLELMDAKYEYRDIERELLFILRNSELSYSKDKLTFNDNTLDKLIKKYYWNAYKNRLNDLKEESESEK